MNDEFRWLLAPSVAFGTEMLYFWTKFRTPFTKDYCEDVVYLYQFRPTPHIPSLSANCLALESWLRLQKIKYENVIGNPWHRSVDGKLPFIELNGSQFSNMVDIISHLVQYFKIDNTITRSTLYDPETAKQYENIIYDLMWCYYYFRYVKNEKNLLSPQLIGDVSPTEPIMPFCEPVLSKMILENDPGYQSKDVKCISENIAKYVEEKLIERGYYQDTEEKLTEYTRSQLEHISDALANKNYLFGRQATFTDCILFGVLAQIIYVPYKSPLKEILSKKGFKNLADHCERMKTSIWSDWDGILKSCE